MPPDIESIAEQVFAALADPTRRAILAALAAEGPATATDLAGRLPITRQAIAKHLALLAEVGLVTAEPGDGAGCVPAPLGAHAGGTAVPGRAGPRLGPAARGLDDTLDRSAGNQHATKQGGTEHHAGSPCQRRPERAGTAASGVASARPRPCWRGRSGSPPRRWSSRSGGARHGHGHRRRAGSFGSFIALSVAMMAAMMPPARSGSRSDGPGRRSGTGCAVVRRLLSRRLDASRPPGVHGYRPHGRSRPPRLVVSRPARTS